MQTAKCFYKKNCLKNTFETASLLNHSAGAPVCPEKKCSKVFFLGICPYFWSFYIGKAMGE
jgi:hypothetical protein